MLPDTFLNYIPKFLKDNIDESGQALVTYMDAFQEEFYDYIREMYFFKDPLRCPTLLLDELGYWLAAGLNQTDSEATKREKIYYAVMNHKKRGTWEDDVKIRIDAITGYSATIFPSGDNDDAILLGQEATDPDYYWMTLQDNSGTDDEWGWWLVGDFTEYVVAGNVYIDCHEGVYTPVLTSDQIDQIVAEIETDVVPAYYAVYLGYINTSGQFVVYAGGVIS